MRVAVYEDDKGVRHFLIRAIERMGHEHVATWHDADAVIVNKRMTEWVDGRPVELDGLDVIRTVRRFRPACRVVAISGEYGGVDGLERLAEEAGAHAWLAKPFTYRELREKLEV